MKDYSLTISSNYLSHFLPKIVLLSILAWDKKHKLWYFRRETECDYWISTPSAQGTAVSYRLSIFAHLWAILPVIYTFLFQDARCKRPALILFFVLNFSLSPKFRFQFKKTVLFKCNSCLLIARATSTYFKNEVVEKHHDLVPLFVWLVNSRLFD